MTEVFILEILFVGLFEKRENKHSFLDIELPGKDGVMVGKYKERFLKKRIYF